MPNKVAGVSRFMGGASCKRIHLDWNHECCPGGVMELYMVQILCAAGIGELSRVLILCPAGVKELAKVLICVAQ